MPDTLTATQGTPAYANGVISWQGLLATGETAAITYTAVLNQCLAGGPAITNSAQLTDGLGTTITRTATVTFENLAPAIPQALAPADGAVNVPVSTLLSWQAADPNCDALTYSVAFGTSSTPPIVAEGLTTPSFDPGLLQPVTTYYWYVTASDGTYTVTSPTWSFTTGNRLYGLPAGGGKIRIQRVHSNVQVKRPIDSSFGLESTEKSDSPAFYEIIATARFTTRDLE